jgi:hypothetical protein
LIPGLLSSPVIYTKRNALLEYCQEKRANQTMHEVEAIAEAIQLAHQVFNSVIISIPSCKKRSVLP